MWELLWVRVCVCVRAGSRCSPIVHAQARQNGRHGGVVGRVDPQQGALLVPRPRGHTVALEAEGVPVGLDRLRRGRRETGGQLWRVGVGVVHGDGLQCGRSA